MIRSIRMFDALVQYRLCQPTRHGFSTCRRPAQWLLGLAMVSASVLAAASPPLDRAAVDRLFQQWNVEGSPGISVGVIAKGQLAYQKGFGYAQLESRQAIGPETVFPIASLSKQFTAMAILLLQQRGQLDLDDRVDQYLPAVVPKVAGSITLRQLMYHTSGLRDQYDLFQLAGHNPADVLTQADVLTLVARQTGLNFEPGTKHQYTNTGYTLLAAVVEQVTGSTLAEWCRREMFAPLGMEHSRFVDDHTMVIAHRADSYHTDSNGIRHRIPLSLATVGATGVSSTTGDLAIWARFVNGGVSGDLHVPPAFYDAGHLANGSPINYGAGLFVEQFRSRRVLEHGGSDAAFQSYIMMFPDDANAVILLANTDDASLAVLARQIAEMAFGLGNASGSRPAPVGSLTPAGACPDAYGGRYVMEDGSLLTVESKDGSCSVRAGAIVMPLRALAAARFRVGDSEVEIEFAAPSEDGQVGGLEVTNSGVTMKGQRLAEEVPADALLQSLAGAYYSAEVDRYFDVAVSGKQLIVALPDGRHLPLAYVGNDTFRSSAAPVMVSFERDRAGTVQAARLSGVRVQHVELIRAERPKKASGS